MVGRTSQEWQPRPSQLRNEMRHTPSDDSRAFAGEEVQVPDSQAGVPDTQIRSDSLSPASAAMVRSNTVTKKIGPPSFSLPLVKPFAKEPSLGKCSRPAEPSVGFAFGQHNRGAEKSLPESSTPPVQATNDGPAVEHLGLADEKHPGSPCPIASTGAVPTSSLQPPVASPCASTKSEDPPSSIVHHDGITAKKADYRREVLDSFSDAPTSAQPTSSHPEARKKILVARKVKKAKKGMQSRQCNGVLPPRSHNASSQIKGTGLVLKAASQKLGQMYMAEPPDEFPVDHEDDQPGATADEIHEHESRDQDQVSPLIAPDVPKASPIRSPEHVSSRPADDPESSAPRSPDALSAEGPNTNDTSNVAIGTHGSQDKPNEIGASPARPFADAVQESGQHDKGVRTAATQIVQSADPRAHLRNHLDQSEATLRGVSNRAAPHRVEKSQKRRRPSKVTQPSLASALLRFQGSPKQVSFEQTWDMLRAAHHSDLTRKDLDVARQAEHFEEVKALLRGQINQYSTSLAEEKSQHESLKSNMSQLREKAKTNQKFATGLEKDYEKLKKVALECQEECKKTLQQKTLELEHEKEALRHEVSVVLENVANGHKKLKSTADELYLRLEFSEAKRMTLADEVTRQAALFAEERAKRNDLEGRLLSFGPCMQEQLRDHSSQLIEELGKLQTSVHSVSSHQQQNPQGVDECLKALRQLQGTPFLTLEHVKKTETMLRAVYEGLGARLDNFAKSVKSKPQPTVDLQAFVKEQLDELRSAMMKFDEVAAQSRRTEDVNTTLRQQLEAEQEDVQRLRKKIDNLHQHEQKLETARADLETQVTSLKDTARDDCEELTTVRQNAEELQRELKQLQDNCEVTKAESEQLRLDLQRRDQEVNECKISIEKLKEENKQLGEKATQECSNEIDLRKQIGDDLRHEFDHQLRRFQDDIDRLTNDRNERDALIQKHHEKMSAAKATSEEVKKDVQKLHSQLEVARKDRDELDSQFKKAQQAAQNASKSAVELASMKEQMKLKEKALEDEEKEFGKLQRAYDALDTQNSNLRTMCEQQQTEINQHPTKLELLRREIEHESIAKQHQEEIVTKEAQIDANTMRKERDNVHAKLEQTQLLASQLTKSHAALVTERDAMKQQSTELEKTRKINESRLLRQEEERVIRAREYEQKLQGLQRQLEQSGEAVRVAEAKIKLQQAEYAKKLEFDRKKYESLVQKLTQDLQENRRPASIERDIAQRSSQSATQSDADARGIQNSNSKKSRKKVDRGNHSSLTFAGFTAKKATPTLMPMSGARAKSPEGHGFDPDRNDNLFEEVSDRFIEEDSLWDQALTLVDPDAEPVEDTQEMPSISMVLRDMDASVSPGPPDESRRGGKLPADQSSLSSPPSSDALARISEDNRTCRTPDAEVHIPRSSAQYQQDERVVETPVREKHISRSSSQLSRSQARPLSQANTSSRMMPPPTTSENFSRHVINKEGSRHHTFRELGHSSRSNSMSPSDHVQNPTSSNNRASDSHESSLSKQYTSRTSGGIEKQKRMITSEQEVSSKRQRQSSQSQPFRSSGSSSHLSRSSQPEQDRDLMTGTLPSQSRPFSSLPLVSPAAGSRSGTKVSPYARQFGSSSGSKSRDNPSSASRLTTPARSQRIYGRHQTRSKTQESERFERELQGL